MDLEIIPGSIPSKHRFLKSYQATYVLQKQILKSGNILSTKYWILKSYQATYCLKIEHSETIPGNVHSTGRGF